ncbi:MAG: TPM domain-containing protein [Rothia sp. (in: high G+C Gram-positive bacteria)]|uniref:TPM domain-containing protein n=1 Tax=Rothia sp. (in: high G+C Gram-positive bacteria) TaxID=1885016 RepID=UPI0026E0E24E|nr:TPM domain-containing protein [Rothia sp. (in: high G+C Gram-positive bacteria)]MDO5750103.1 TPM domain-containing protein [Rothia sp. (in: high G+C Gram-positive bacteria)]
MSQPRRSFSAIVPHRARSLRALGAGSLALGLSLAPIAFTSSMPAAYAATPAAFSNSLVDQSNVLSNASSLRTDLTSLANDKGVYLHVVIVDTFDSPSNNAEWTKELAKKNGWGSADVVLAIASKSRQFYFYALSSKHLSSSQVQTITQEKIRPKLASNDWDGAVKAAIDGVRSAKNGSLKTSSSGVVAGALAVGALGVAGGAGYYLYTRRRKDKQHNAPYNRYGYANPGYSVPQVSITQLKTQAGSALVTADNTMLRAQQELEFARAMYGDAAVAEFSAQLQRAQELMNASFHRQRLLEDDVPDTEAEQRAWYTEIIENSQKIAEISAEQDQKLGVLRNLEQDAPALLDRLESQLPELTTLIHNAKSQYQQLGSLYTSSALAPVAHTPELLDSNYSLTGEEIKTARSLLPVSRSEAVTHLRTAEEAAQQVRSLSQSLIDFARTQEEAQQNLETAVLALRRDIAQAQALGDTDRQLAARAAGMGAVVDQIQQQASQRPNDPVTLIAQLSKLSEDLNESLAAQRSQQDRERAAAADVDKVLQQARIQVESARTFINNRRGSVGARARTALSEAEQHLASAQRQVSSNPLGAHQSAERAINMAIEAQNSASDDVTGYYQQHSNNSGGSDFFGGDNFAKGMLLGTLLNWGSSSSAWGSSHSGSSGWSSSDSIWSSSGSDWGGGGGWGGDSGGSGDGGSF